MANIATELYKYYTALSNNNGDGNGNQNDAALQNSTLRNRTTKRKRSSPSQTKRMKKNSVRDTSCDKEPKDETSEKGDNIAQGKSVAALVEMLTSPLVPNPVGQGLRFASRRTKTKTKKHDHVCTRCETAGSHSLSDEEDEDEPEGDKVVLPKDGKAEPLNAAIPQANMALMFVVTDYMRSYRNHVWPLYPLHPAVFDDSNVEHYLGTSIGLAEKSSMALNFNVALMFGCLLTGDAKVTSEFYMQARQQLDYLCQHTYHTITDYSIAMAVMGLAYYTLYVRLEVIESVKLISLAMAICKRINAINSDIYVRCLLSLSLHPMRNYEILKNIVQEVEDAKDLPYYPLVAATKAKGVTEMQAGNNGRAISALQQQMPVSLQNLKTIASSTRVAANVLALLFMCTETIPASPIVSADLGQDNPSPLFVPSSSSPASPISLSPPLSPDIGLHTADLGLSSTHQHQQHPHQHHHHHQPHGLLPPASPPPPPPTTAELSDLTQLLKETTEFEEMLSHIVEALYQQMHAVQMSSRDPLPACVESWFVLLTNALSAKCNLHLGRRATAFKHAMLFLTEVRNPRSAYVLFAGDFIDFVLEVFVELGKFDCIHELLDAIEPWARLVPATRRKKDDIALIAGLGLDPIEEVARAGLAEAGAEGLGVVHRVYRGVDDLAPAMEEEEAEAERKKAALLHQLDSERESMLKMEEKIHWMEQVMLSLKKDIERKRTSNQQLHPSHPPQLQLHHAQVVPPPHPVPQPQTATAPVVLGTTTAHNHHHHNPHLFNNIYGNHQHQWAGTLDVETFLPPEVFHMPKTA